MTVVVNGRERFQVRTLAQAISRGRYVIVDALLGVPIDEAPPFKNKHGHEFWSRRFERAQEQAARLNRAKDPSTVIP